MAAPQKKAGGKSTAKTAANKQASITYSFNGKPVKPSVYRNGSIRMVIAEFADGSIATSSGQPIPWAQVVKLASRS